MNRSPMQIIDEIRQQLVTGILAGPKPPPEEMALLSQEYQDVWRAEDEEPSDALLATALDENSHWSAKPRTPAEHTFAQETERLLRRKRWIESEQLTSLTRIEQLLTDDERWRQNVLEQSRTLSQQIEACREECQLAPPPAQAAAARRCILECQNARRANVAALAKLDRAQEKALSAIRRSAIEYQGLLKTMEARKGCRRLVGERERAASGGLGILGTIGMVLAIHDFQKMAHGIDKLAKKK
ncbi:MAG: hypothetical protein HQ582_27640 [Planctomycetes bacterium]|nr:hypothetical protein [Planctomycetota bacterium]